jgi:N-acetylglucosaminyldiphosphoundecaprenol N-acetyl-beta-D-mannosaminyltransferase
VAINTTAPDIVWVGLSTPKQEVWMAEQRPHLNAKVLIGVGAAFDFHAGMVRQAPRWLQRGGLEWLFRLAIEPRRLGRRYLVNNPSFVANVFLQELHLARFDLQ